MVPHLDHAEPPPTAHAESGRPALSVPGYALDDQTASTVTDGHRRRLSEGGRLVVP